MSSSHLTSPLARRNHVALLLAAGLTALALALSGCGQGLGGGAHYQPVVSIFPDADATADTGTDSAADVQVAGYGTLKGRVIVEGTVNAPGPINPTKDAGLHCQGTNP